MALHHWFIPHKDTNKKAHLLSWHALIIYGLIFMILHTGFSLVGLAKPGVLGTTSSIQIQQIISMTNDQRAQNSLPPLKENSDLDSAAEAKAQNMFAENYWAHYAPSGKTPWDFILGSGYKFTYAGENLAKNFSSSGDVISAWMASPSHKENIVNTHYQDIGVAVEDGVINGEHTTLVVQEFGSPSIVASLPAAKPTAQPAAVQPSNKPVAAQPVPTEAPVEVTQQDYDQKSQVALVPVVKPVVSSVQGTQALFDPIKISKVYSLIIIGLISALLILDFFILKRRGVFRLSSHHFAHMAILSVAATAILSSHSGNILDGLKIIAPPNIIHQNENP